MSSKFSLAIFFFHISLSPLSVFFLSSSTIQLKLSETDLNWMRPTFSLWTFMFLYFILPFFFGFFIRNVLFLDGTFGHAVRF